MFNTLLKYLDKTDNRAIVVVELNIINNLDIQNIKFK